MYPNLSDKSTSLLVLVTLLVFIWLMVGQVLDSGLEQILIRLTNQILTLTIMIALLMKLVKSPKGIPD